MASEPKPMYTIVKWLILTSNSQATKLLSSFLITYTVKAFNAIVSTPQTVWIEKTKQQNPVTLFTLILCDILSSSCNAQYFHMTEYTHARLAFTVFLVGN